MREITIQLPAIEAEQSIEIEVRVNGKSRRYNYRVEIFAWEDCVEDEGRANCLQRMLSKHDKNWRLVHIGAPDDKAIPLMFKEKDLNN